ncbi:hypothetical protein B0H17DRAFT_1222499 [Mycena rosella]|uniref:Uncharacterized protein n=1 Tax=Mycena rosella TaxID=1033263 RepID=A0AAD7AY95_MYCRO|nr:hypothetical protein B0H17DRAFT_1222499 [Mycena rosella]
MAPRRLTLATVHCSITKFCASSSQPSSLTSYPRVSAAASHSSRPRASPSPDFGRDTAKLIHGPPTHILVAVSQFLASGERRVVAHIACMLIPPPPERVAPQSITCRGWWSMMQTSPMCCVATVLCGQCSALSTQPVSSAFCYAKRVPLALESLATFATSCEGPAPAPAPAALPSAKALQLPWRAGTRICAPPAAGDEGKRKEKRVPRSSGSSFEVGALSASPVQCKCRILGLGRPSLNILVIWALLGIVTYSGPIKQQFTEPAPHPVYAQSPVQWDAYAASDTGLDVYASSEFVAPVEGYVGDECAAYKRLEAEEHVEDLGGYRRHPELQSNSRP